jgi:glycosyltransferase involved in cell wall biosynthesis
MNAPEIRHLYPAVNTKTPLQIAVVTETYPPDINGVAHTLSKIVQALTSNGHTVCLVRPRHALHDFPKNKDNFSEYLVQGFPIPFYKQLRMGLPAKKVLTRLWTESRPDVVHIATEGPLGWSALKAAQSLSIPVSTDFRTNFHTYSEHYGVGWLGGIIMGYLRRFHNAANSTMVPTSQLRKELVSAGFERLHVVQRGVDTHVFSPMKRSNALRAAWGATKATTVAICVSRLAAEKNLHLVIRAFQALKLKQPDSKLVFVGDGPMLEQLKVDAPGAIFAGFRTGEDLATHYASADMFMFASLTETFGNVTIEAMASGLPIVAFNHAAAGEIIESGLNGILANSNDEAGFMDASIQLGQDSNMRSICALGARDKALQFSWESIVKKTEDVLYGVCATEKSAN